MISVPSFIEFCGLWRQGRAVLQHLMVWGAGLGLMSGVALGVAPAPASADDEETIWIRPPGLCLLNDETAGRWIHNGRGEMVSLRTICSDPDAWAAYRDSFEPTPDDEATVTTSATVTVSEEELSLRSPEALERQFWSTFLTAASPEAIAFAQGLERSAVLDYGQTICPLLDQDTTMDQVRATQIEGDLPADFDAAVNVAAIHTYCPHQLTQIGR